MSQTNYIPGINILKFGVDYGPYGSGSGSPNGTAVGYPGYVYTDSATGNFWVFNGTSGANTGWVEVTGGGGSGGTGLSGSGTPQAVVTAAVGTTYLDTASGDFWVKQTGSGNTGWLQLIGG